MLAPPFHNALVLTGPTASGKTRLGIQLATDLSAEIISMDSMALYRGMDIGTAKPTPEERARIPHHLIDVLDPWESSNVAWWLEQARRLTENIERRGKRVFFVGGTPLYLKALIFGLFEGPPVDPSLRQRLEEEAQTQGTLSLYERLQIADPASAQRVHPNDARRVIRALEVFESTGKPISAWQTQWSEKEEESGGESQEVQEEGVPRILWLDMQRDVLYDRINRRVEAMFKEGLVDEVRRLRDSDLGMSREARQALGYKEILMHLAGQASLAETIVQVQTRTRNFAKRQITWFRHLPGCIPTISELTGTHWHPTMHSGRL